MKPEINAALLKRLKEKQNKSYTKNGGNKDYEDRGYDWLFLGGKGRFVFRLLPPSAEDYQSETVFSPFYIYSTHKNLGSDGKDKAICIEDGDSDAICPICETIRELNELGISVPDQEVRTRYAFKVLLLQCPEKEQSELQMDRVTVLFVSESICDRIMKMYLDPMMPPLFEANKSCAIMCERDDPKGKWNISHLDTSMPQCGVLGGSEENCQKLLEIVEKNPFSSIFKLPTDNRMMHYKELAKELKTRCIKAKMTASTAVASVKKVMTPVEETKPTQEPVTPPPEKITVSKPVEDEKEEVVATPAIPETVEAIKEPTVEITDNSGYFDEPLTEEQKKIIDSYRNKCDKPCFGSHKAYDPKCEMCMCDPYSTQCALAIKEAFGKDVPLF